MMYYKVGQSFVKTYKELNAERITSKEYDDEMEAIEEEIKVQSAISEASRPMTESEVLAMLIPQQINTLSVDDNTALRMLDFYPEWSADTDYATGYKVQHGGKLWRCLQTHTSQTGWEPNNAPSLWAKVLIPDETVIPEWEQPGSTNPYMAGDKVAHNGKTWVSAVDNNVWEPGVYGWSEVSEQL